MTKKENFNAIATILNEMGNHDFDEFIAHEVELLNKKRTGSKTPTKRQKENEILKEHILGVLSDEGMTVTEIMTTLNEDGLTNQRVSANLKQMVDNGTVNKAVVKGKSLFTLA